MLRERGQVSYNAIELFYIIILQVRIDNVVGGREQDAPVTTTYLLTALRRGEGKESSPDFRKEVHRAFLNSNQSDH